VSEASDKDAYDAMNYEFDGWTKLRMRELVNHRMAGELDDTAFVKKFTEISEGAGYDYSERVAQPDVFAPPADEQRMVYDDIYEDRTRLREELWYQHSCRMKKHLFLTKRKEGDFIQPRMSESNVYGRQVLAHEDGEMTLNEQIEKYNTEEEKKIDEDDRSFSRQEYEKFKVELRQRKEAKEALLSQGLPQFKAYLRF